MKVSIQSVDINPKNLSFDQMRQLIDGLLSGNPKEGKRLWDAMACVRGPDLGLNGTNAKIDGSTPAAESARVARKKQTCTIIRGKLFPGASGCSAADINTNENAVIHLPPKADWDHYDKHVHKVAVNLNIPYEIEGEPKKSLENTVMVCSIPYPEKLTFPLDSTTVLFFQGNHGGGRKIFKTADGIKVFLDIMEMPDVPYSSTPWILDKPYNGDYLYLTPQFGGTPMVAEAKPSSKYIAWPTNCWGFNHKSGDITLKAVTNSDEWALWKGQAKDAKGIGGSKKNGDQIVLDTESHTILYITKNPVPGSTTKTLLYYAGPAKMGTLFAAEPPTTVGEEYIPDLEDDNDEGN